MKTGVFRSCFSVAWTESADGSPTAEQGHGRALHGSVLNTVLSPSKRNPNATRNKCIATSNKCLTSSNKKNLIRIVIIRNLLIQTYMGGVNMRPIAPFVAMPGAPIVAS